MPRNLAPVSTTPGELGAKFTAAVVDTGGALDLHYLHDFSKKIEMTLMLYSGAWGKKIHEKNRNQKSRDTLPLGP